MSSAIAPLHPVLACADAIDAALKDVADANPGFMSVPDKKQALLQLTSEIARLEELRLRVLAGSDDVAEAEGARDPAAWLAFHARMDPGHCRRLQKLARGLDQQWPGLAAAMREGTVNAEQADVIARALDELPSGLSADVRTQAQDHLIGEAVKYGPKALKTLGRKIADVVDPDGTDAREAKQLEDEERRGERNTEARVRNLGNGRGQFTFIGSLLIIRRLIAYLEAFTNPRRPAETGADADARADADAGSGREGAAGPAEGASSTSTSTSTGPAEDRRTYPQRLGAAFAAFLEAFDPRRLPLHGGDATTVVVKIDYASLCHQVGASLVAEMGDQPITAAEARRLACNAKILPAVLDGDSEVLDLGRSQRLFSAAQRRAHALLHATCQARGCDIPATWCEGHHRQPWSLGGRTDLRDLVLLCSHHHHTVHDPKYETTYHLDGTVTFRRRRG